MQLVTQYPLHTPNHGWVHLWPLVHAIVAQRKIKAEHPGQLTLDRAFRGRIMVEPLPGANFHANQGRRRAR